MGGHGARLLTLLLLSLAAPSPGGAQAIAEPVLVGRVLLGDTALSTGTVVLHHVDSVEQGEIDSVAVAPDGSFMIRLPAMPSGTPDEMYFASVQHDGVMYFGNFITRPVELDSLYLIQAYDTVMAPTTGVPVALEARMVFFESAGAQWAVTDLFELRNDDGFTYVPQPGGWVWSYPLPEGAREVAAMEDISSETIVHQGSDIVFRAALPPGGRSLVLRYFVDSLGVVIPTPGEVEMLDVLVREPAPSVAVEGLAQAQSILLDNGSTYRRFSGQQVALSEVRIGLAEETPPPPVEWIAVVLSLVLLGGGLLALRGSGRAVRARASAPADDRGAILLQIAQLDEEFEKDSSPSEARRQEYKRRRADLMDRLRPKV